jgi:hypothetical protein
MAALDMRPQAPAPAPAYLPDEDDLAEMSRIRAVHDLLDVAPDLPLSVRLGLLDYAAAVLGGNGQPASEPRRTA